MKHFTCWNQLLAMMFGQLSNPVIALHDIDKKNGHPSIKGMRSFADQVLKMIEKIKISPHYLSNDPKSPDASRTGGFNLHISYSLRMSQRLSRTKRWSSLCFYAP